MKQERIGRKRLVVGAHYGTRDFIAQRMTAVIMGFYTLALVLYAMFVPSLDFYSWRAFFAFTLGTFPMGQVLATMAFLSLAWHAWIGMRDIAMDYARIDGLRLILEVLFALWVLGTAIYFGQILWSL